MTSTIIWVSIGLILVGIVVAAAISVHRDGKRDKMIEQLPPIDMSGTNWQRIAADPGMFLVFNRFRGFWAEPEPELDKARPDPRDGAVWLADSSGKDTVIKDAWRAEVRGQHIISFTYAEQLSLYQVAAVRLTHPRPTLVVSTENVVSRLTRDLQLESLDFNTEFKIATSNARFAYDVLCPPVMEFLKHDPRSRYFTLEIDGQHVRVSQQYSVRVQKPTSQMQQAVADYLVQIMTRVPAFVWR
ncbi:hypothetical protein EV191_101155 [Tamaricihabitans halophyticus]|uniref:DUF3137 domain-containing protein n=1 Tax=Tamaricihabitans halophyticus TaxID=1262583 RepID=A0A4R2R9Y2_9PSEU|nr:hypothetical protein [Tamaricihabitans halophyticus]TCP56215.1 hypothetical protein EV191_101155 [Tamaricihabitans halophyticus]